MSPVRAQQEARRVAIQAELYDPITRRFLIEAGIGKGMRVLDIGSRTGAVASLASELVGPRGSVLGIEYTEAMVKAATERVSNAGRKNVTFVQADVDTLRLSSGFDAIVGRFILRDLRDAAKTLRRLSRLLVPGGIIAFQEKIIAIPVTSFPALTVVEQVQSWMDETRRHAGVEVALGAELPRLYRAAGLPSPKVRLDAPVGYGPDWKGYRLLTETLRGMLPLIPLYHIATEEQIAIGDLEDRMRAEAVRLGALVVLTPCVGAWAECRHVARRRAGRTR